MADELSKGESNFTKGLPDNMKKLDKMTDLIMEKGGFNDLNKSGLELYNKISQHDFSKSILEASDMLKGNNEPQTNIAADPVVQPPETGYQKPFI